MGVWLKRWTLFAFVMLAHFGLSFAALLWAFGISSDQFDGHATSALASYGANGLLAVTKRHVR